MKWWAVGMGFQFINPYQGESPQYFQFFQYLYYTKINQQHSKDQKYDKI